MEAGVGRGQHRGQHYTSCMLGNAGFFFLSPIFTPSLPISISSCKYRCTHLVRDCACTPPPHTHTLTSSPPLLSPILIHSSKLFSIFLISFFLTLSLKHSFTHAYLHLFHFRSLSLLNPPPSCLILICKWREDLTEEYVQKMRFLSQVGNCGGRWKGREEEEEEGREEEGEEESRNYATIPLSFTSSLSLG